MRFAHGTGCGAEEATAIRHPFGLMNYRLKVLEKKSDRPVMEQAREIVTGIAASV